MIVRKEDYKVHEAAYLLDLPSRTILALCDAGIITCSRLVANGALKQRKRRHVSHCEVVRFNMTRAAEFRSDLASRLSDPDAEQPSLPFAPEPDAPEANGQVAVWLSKIEWRATCAAINVMVRQSDILTSVSNKIGPAGVFVMTRGLRVRNYEDIAV